MRRCFLSSKLTAAALLLLQASCGGDGGTEPAPSVAAKLALTTAPSGSVANRVAFATQPVVQLQDAKGKVVAQSGVVVTVFISSGGGTLGGTATATTTSTGAAVFTDLSITGSVGDRTLTFSSPGLTSATATVALMAGPAAAIAVNSGDAQFAPAGTAVVTAPSVKVTDADDNAVAGVEVVFSVASGGGSITGTTQITNVSGIATVGSWTLSAAVGANTLNATASGLSSTPVSFTATVQARMVTAGDSRTCALTTSGSAYCWGEGDVNTVHPTPVAVGGALMFETLVAGHDHRCGLTATGAMYCWGTNYGAFGNGMTLGSGSETPLASGGGLTFRNMTIGGASGPENAPAYTCGVTLAGSAYCWGGNGTGQLGDGTTVTRLNPVPISGGLLFQAVVAGLSSAHTCGLIADGAAYCWGYNRFGQLGDGTTVDRLTPVAVVGGLKFQSLSIAGNRTCGVATTGTGHCWGWNGHGQLGDGTTIDRDSPAVVTGGLTFQSLTAGHWHTCGLAITGAAYCWGQNFSGQLGDGTTTGRATPVAVAGGLKFQALTAGLVTELGTAHTCGVTTSGAPYCWGENSRGELGDGTGLSRSTPVAVRAGK